MGVYNYSNANTNSNIDKTRIYQYWGSEIVLDEISVALYENTNTHNVIDKFSIEVPIVRINDTILSEFELLSLNIDCTGFLPQLELKSVFLYDRFLLMNQIKDGDLISIVIRSQSDNLKIIRNDYIVKSAFVSERYDTGDANQTPYMITFLCELFIPKLDLGNLDLSFLGTSYETIQNVSKMLDLGFASNDINTNDRQVWLSCNNTPREFLEDIKGKMWKDENSFYDIWIDLFYNLNIVNVNAQLLSSEEELDYGVILNSVNTNYNYGGNTKKNEIFPKILSNLKGWDGSSSYIKSWYTNNSSSAITSMMGTVMNCNMYEHNDKIYNTDGTLFWSLPIEPLYDSEKLNSHIILRGRCTYNPEINTGELARSNYKATEIFKKQKWVGIQYTCTNTNDDTSNWDGNQHMNYNRAIIHNDMNLRELEKLNTIVTVIGTNVNLIKGDKMPILLINNSLETPNKEKGEMQYNTIDRFHSGWYYIKGFNITWIGGEVSAVSKFSQSFILTRREWPTPDEVTPIKSK